MQQQDELRERDGAARPQVQKCRAIALLKFLRQPQCFSLKLSLRQRGRHLPIKNPGRCDDVQ